jgi:formylglycine-generating enzyme required for sulfatase activity
MVLACPCRPCLRLGARAVVALFACAAMAQDRGQAVRAALTADGVVPACHALVIGINEYLHWQDLRRPREDAQALAGVLRQFYGFNDVRLLLDSQATRKAVMGQLEDLLSLGEGDSLIVFFAGHGGYNRGLNEGYWVPHEAEKNSTADYLLNSTVQKFISRMKARHVLVVSDSCFSGALLRGDNEPLPSTPDAAWYRRILVRPSRYAITSGDLESVPDDSVFATKFINQLRYADAVLSAKELALTLEKEIPRFTKQTVLSGRIPNDPNDENGQFVFVRVRMTVKPPDPGVVTPPVVAPPVVETLAGSLRIECLSAGALRVGNRVHTVEAGKTYTFRVAVGRQTVRLEGDGEPWQETVEVMPGQVARLTARVTPRVSDGMVFIRGGTFRMGSEDGDSDEKPVHRVTVRDFYMSKCELTVGEFRTFVEKTGYRTTAEKEGWAYAWNGTSWGKVNGASWRSLGFEQTDRHPVVCVSWDDAQEYCRWLSRKTGKTYRLPTEAEWEYACRAGTTTTYPWGDDPDAGAGWCNAADRTAKEKFPGRTVFNWRDGYVFTAPVGSFKANTWGLHDMIGNVWEWCQDWCGEYPVGSVTDPAGPGSGSNRVIRGGGWNNYARLCRSANRGRGCPGARGRDLGCRLVRTGSSFPER